MSSKPKGNVESIYPLTPLQEGLLLHTLQAPTSGLYFEQYACRLAGNLDVVLFQEAWDRVVARHAVLRTLFTWEKRDRPLQLVRGRVRLSWESVDWRGEDEEANLAAYLEADRTAGFSLDRAPLCRFALFRVDDDTWRFVWSFHHLILDGWSMRLVWNEVRDTYEALADGREPTLAPQRPFRDYVTWLQSGPPAGAEAYWRQRLKGFTEPTPLPAAVGGPARSWTEEHEMTEVSLTEAETERLQQWVRGQRITVNTALRGAWGLLLARSTGQSDVVFGATSSGRPPELENVESMVGLFINTLPVRVRLSDSDNVPTFLRGLQQDQVEASAFESTPLVEISRWSEVDRRDLFSSVLVFENLGSTDEASESRRLRVTDPRFVEESHYPLALLVVPESRLRFLFVYDSDLWKLSEIRAVGRSLRRILLSWIELGDPSLASTSLLSPSEMGQLVRSSQGPELPGPQANVVEQVHRKALDHPHETALIFEDQSLTYEALWQRVEAVASSLHQAGVGPDVVVGVCLERSLDLVPAIFGILAAGGAYLPLDPAQPVERIQDQLDDADARLVVTHSGFSDRLPDEVEQLKLDTIDVGGRGSAESIAPNSIRGDAAAYIIFTSGSTGRPKGVVVTHDNLAHSTAARFHYYPKSPGRFLLVSPYVFDSSVAGLFWTLTSGGTLVLPGNQVEQDVRALRKLVAVHAVTHMLLLPALYDLLIEDARSEELSSLQCIVVAGEAPDPGLPVRHRDVVSGASLFNEYGPTEATVWSTVECLHDSGQADPDSHEEITIGRPIANTWALVLDSELRMLPPGIPGELCLGGPGLARGYLGEDADGTGRFLTVDLPERRPLRIYRTGDRVRRLEDGRLEFLGRVDGQIKIRGHRIEPGEIESCLRSLPLVSDAAVVYGAPDEDPVRGERSDSSTSGRRRLVAFVERRLDGGPEPGSDAGPELGSEPRPELRPEPRPEPGSEPRPELGSETGSHAGVGAELREEVARRLPRVMVPDEVVVLGSLPRTASGKVRREALSIPAPGNAATESSPKPDRELTDGEAALLGIWRDVLGREEIGLADDFFSIGGDSILSIRVLSRAGRAGLRVTPQEFFEGPTIAEMARAASAAADDDAQTPPSGDLDVGPVPLTPIQHWFFETVDVDPHHWNQGQLYELSRSFSTEELRLALRRIMARHAGLSLGFRREGAGPWIGFYDPAGARRDILTVRDLGTVPELDSSLRAIEADAHAGLDLAQPPLLRAVHVRSSNHPDHLLIVAHHLIVDWVSWQILEDELRIFLGTPASESEPNLPTSVSFPSWARTYPSAKDAEAARAEAAYWEAAAALGGNLPVPNPNAADSWADRDVVSVFLDPEQTALLSNEAPSAYRAQVVDLLMTAFLRSLVDWAGSTRVAVAMEGHGRGQEADLAHSVGWFTVVYPVSFELSVSGDVDADIKGVKEQLRSVPRGGRGYGDLRYLDLDSEVAARLRARPLPDALFNYLGQEAGEESTVSPPAPWSSKRGAEASARSPRSPRPHRLEVNVWMEASQLRADWTFGTQVWSRDVIEGVAWRFEKELRTIIDHCVSASGGSTPSDFPLAGLDQGELDKLAGLLGDDDFSSS